MRWGNKKTENMGEENKRTKYLLNFKKYRWKLCQFFIQWRRFTFWAIFRSKVSSFIFFTDILNNLGLLHTWVHNRLWYMKCTFNFCQISMCLTFSSFENSLIIHCVTAYYNLCLFIGLSTKQNSCMKNKIKQKIFRRQTSYNNCYENKY